MAARRGTRRGESGRSLLRLPPGCSGAALDGTPGRRGGRAADDAGFTPAEIIIGVILVGILATGVTIKAVQMMDQARNSAAQTTLKTAASAAEGVFGIILKGGTSNYAGLNVDSAGKLLVNGTAATALYTDSVNKAMIENLNLQEPNITFLSTADTTANQFPTGGLKDYAPDGRVWTQVLGDKLETTSTVTLGGNNNPNRHQNRLYGSSPGVKATAVRAGELVRMGIVSSGGSSFCVIKVADSIGGIISGDGWQAVNEEQTLKGAGADCGMEKTPSTTDEFKEMPGTVGTDPTLSSPTGNLSSTPATAQEYLSG